MSNNPWIEHVRKVAKDEGISYMCAISKASETYDKKGREKKLIEYLTQKEQEDFKSYQKKLKTIDEASDNLKPIDSENLQLIDDEKSQVIINEELDQKLDKNMEFKANQDNKKLFKFKKNNPNLDHKNTQSKEDLIKNSTEKNENLAKENEDGNIKKFKFKKLQNSEKLEYENIQSAEDPVNNLTKEKEVQNIKKFKLKKSDSGLEKYKLLEEENI